MRIVGRSLFSAAMALLSADALVGQDSKPPTSAACRSWAFHAASFSKAHDPYGPDKKRVTAKAAAAEFGPATRSEAVLEESMLIYDLDVCEGWVAVDSTGLFGGAGVRVKLKPPAPDPAIAEAVNASARRVDALIATLEAQLVDLRSLRTGLVPAAAQETAATSIVDLPTVKRLHYPIVAPATVLTVTPSPGTGASAAPTYAGPKGGEYHYSKNGKKVYTKRK